MFWQLVERIIADIQYEKGLINDSSVTIVYILFSALLEFTHAEMMHRCSFF